MHCNFMLTRRDACIYMSSLLRKNEHFLLKYLLNSESRMKEKHALFSK